MILYHSTTEEAAESILENGFRDSPFLTCGNKLHGVFLSSKPTPHGEVTLTISINYSKDQLLDLEGVMLEESGDSEDTSSYDIWFVPSRFLNAGSIELTCGPGDKVFHSVGRKKA